MVAEALAAATASGVLGRDWGAEDEAGTGAAVEACDGCGASGLPGACARGVRGDGGSDGCLSAPWSAHSQLQPSQQHAPGGRMPTR